MEKKRNLWLLKQDWHEATIIGYIQIHLVTYVSTFCLNLSQMFQIYIL